MFKMRYSKFRNGCCFYLYTSLCTILQNRKAMKKLTIISFLIWIGFPSFAQKTDLIKIVNLKGDEL